MIIHLGLKHFHHNSIYYNPEQNKLYRIICFKVAQTISKFIVNALENFGFIIIDNNFNFYN